MDGHTARKLISENENSGIPMVVALTANCDQVCQAEPSEGVFQVTTNIDCFVATQPTKDRCLREGFADFLTKPLIISDLAKLLERVYHARHQTTPDSALFETSPSSP